VKILDLHSLISLKAPGRFPRVENPRAPDKTHEKVARSKLILGRSIAARRGMGFAAGDSRKAGELVIYSGDGHLISFAPTATGKTSWPVISNALTHPGQLIVLDMKGEVFAATAQARRAMGRRYA